MSEEQAVYNAVNHEGTPEERLKRLECAYNELLQHAVTHQELDKSDLYWAGQVDDLRREMQHAAELHLQAVNVLQIHDQELSQRIDRLQDANLGSVLLVELRRISDALETLASTVYAEDEFKHQREVKVGGWQ